MKFFILFILISSVYADTNFDPDDHSLFSCKRQSREVVDLKSQVLGSLRFANTQDQGSQGTCYANSASLMLESYLGYPVSYHQLALQGNAQSIEDKKLGPSSFLKRVRIHGVESDEFINHGGLSCEAINNAVKTQLPLCHRDLVALENLTRDGRNSQEILSILGKFYDKNMHNTEAAKVLALASEKANNSKFLSCGNKTDLKNKAAKSLKSLISPVIMKLLESCNKSSDLNHALICKKELGIFGEVERDSSQLPSSSLNTLNGFEKNQEVSLKISQAMNENISSLLDGLKNRSFKTRADKDNFTDSILDGLFKNIIRNNIKREYIYKEFIGEHDNLLQAIKTSIGSLGREQIIALTSFVNPKMCRAFEKLKTFKRVVDSKCRPDSSLPILMRSIDSMSHHFFGDPKFIETVLDTLSSSQGSRVGLIQNLIGKECFKSGRPLPKNLSCIDHDFPVTYFSPLKGAKNKKPKYYCYNRLDREDCIKMYCTTKEECEKLNKSTNTFKVRDAIYSQLKKKAPTGLDGMPVEVTMCTGFMNVKGYNMNYGTPKITTRECVDSKEHGLHSMSAIGMRCKNGKVQYKIQNSWGRDATYKNPDLEVVPGEGSFWISEDDFVNNLTGFSGVDVQVHKFNAHNDYTP